MEKRIGAYPIRFFFSFMNQESSDLTPGLFQFLASGLYNYPTEL